MRRNITTLSLTVLCALCTSSAPSAFAQYEPAATPALTPAEAEKRFAVPPGFAVRLFAAEPDVVNPVAMSWDSRGRLYVLELIEYPLGAKKDAKPRDRVKILEDTDGDGRADKVTVFADGFNLATGLLCGDGGVYVGQAPDLIFLKDTNGDDIADERTVLLTGFGLNDRHELLNGFAWGPDGWLWLTHGVFVHSKVKNPDDPNDDGVQMNAAIARFHPKTRKFEIVADGTSNPWGVDFDRAGNAFVSACVIDHLFHIVPGGSYVRQAGTPGNPYAYDLLPSIVDHKHQRAAYCGINIYQGDLFPEEYRGNAYMGNIHANCINRDKLTPNGSTFKASALPDFLTANDGWFRPIAIHSGPDGAMWIADWYDKYPCYQNAMATPDLIDREKGRIWRVVYNGKTVGATESVAPTIDAPRKTLSPWPYRGEDLAKWPSDRLVGLLGHPNVWQRRMGQRLISERKDESLKKKLFELSQTATTQESRLFALWTLHGMGLLDFRTAVESSLVNFDETKGSWIFRLLNDGDTETLTDFRDIDGDVKNHPVYLLGKAISLRRMTRIDNWETIRNVADWSSVVDDPVIQHILWLRLENVVVQNPKSFFDPIVSLAKVDQSSKSNAQEIKYYESLLRKVTRRICDQGSYRLIDSALDFLRQIAGTTHSSLVIRTLDGLLDGQQGKILKPDSEWSPILHKLAESSDSTISDRALRLAALWGDAGATAKLLAAAADPAASEGRRIEAVRTARRVKGDAARDVLLAVVAADGTPGPVLTEAVRGLADVGGDGVPGAILDRWKALPADARRAALEVLASRPAWAVALLAAVETKAVAAADVPAPARRSLSQIEDPAVQAAFGRAFGKFRQTPEEKAKVIAEKKLMVLSGPVDYVKGRNLTKKTCLTCHSFLGEGANVGPDLTGVGRSTLDALLANIIDPSQVIGEGYENTIVQTKDEQIFTGRIIADTPEKITLLSVGPVEKTIPRDEIDVIRKTDQSLMPEGLWQMPDDDFRNLVWYVFSPPAEPTLKLRADRSADQATVSVRNPAGEGWTTIAAQQTVAGGEAKILLLSDAAGRRISPAAGILHPRIGQIGSVRFDKESDGARRFVRLIDMRHEEGRAGWRSQSAWVGPDGETLVEEEQDVTVHGVEPGKGYAVDVAWTLRGLKEKWTIIVGSEANGLALQLADPKGAEHVTAAGRIAAGMPVQTSAWAGATLPGADSGSPPIGIAWLAHPANPSNPPAWRLGVDAFLNPSMNPYGDWGVSTKGPRTYRYRFLVRPGPVDPATVAAELERFKALPAD